MINDLHNNYDMRYKNVDTSNKDMCYRVLKYWSQSYKTNSYVKKHPKVSYYYKIYINLRRGKRRSKIQQKKRMHKMYLKPFSVRKNKRKKFIIAFFRREEQAKTLKYLHSIKYPNYSKSID